MKPAAKLAPTLLIAALALNCQVDKASAPLPNVSMDRASAPGLAQACRDKPGQHLARRPSAPVALLCAFTLPSGSSNIQNGTKSWVDGGKYYLTELANGSVYIFDVADQEYLGRVTGFVGATGVAATSGPNSIVFSADGRAWVSDGISSVRVVDLASNTIIASINTAIGACDNGTIHNCQRTNEIDFDPEHRIIFVQNPSPLSLTGVTIDTYGTFISADPPYAVLGTITFADRRGQEASVYDAGQHRFVTTVSGRQVVTGGAVTALYHQYVGIIDPTVRPFTLERKYDVDCTALGLTVAPTPANPTGRVFGINDPALGSDGRMVLPACGRALIFDPRNGATTVLDVGGGNETWFNTGDGNYYVTGMNFSATPGPNSLGVIDASSATVRQYLPAISATNPAAAADNNHIYAVVPANANATACTPFGFQSSGCILVFAHVPGGGE